MWRFGNAVVTVVAAATGPTGKLSPERRITFQGFIFQSLYISVRRPDRGRVGDEKMDRNIRRRLTRWLHLQSVWVRSGKKNLSAKKWLAAIHRPPTMFLPLDFFAVPYVLTGTTRI